MSPSINLVPFASIVARQRIVRRNCWVGVTLAAALILLCGGFVRFAASGAEAQRSDHLAVLAAQQADVDRQLSMLLKQRASLLDRGRGLASLRQPQPVPEQLVALGVETPDGVYLSELRASLTPAEASRITPPTGDPGAKTAAPAAAAQSTGGSAAPGIVEPEYARTIQLVGTATDHARLAEFLENVRRVPGWERVELLRAARETPDTGGAPKTGQPAVAFRVECRERRVAP